jgi:SH3-like domain-containing protein
MHSRLASLYAQLLPLRLLPPPVKIPVMREYMSWHRSLDGDAMLIWLRNKLLETVRSFETPPLA